MVVVIAIEGVGSAAEASHGRLCVLETMVQFVIGKACGEEKWMAEIRDPRKGAHVLAWSLQHHQRSRQDL